MLYVKFAIPPTEIEYKDIMLPFELLYKDNKPEEVPSGNIHILKNKLLNSASLKVIKSCGIKQILVVMRQKP